MNLLVNDAETNRQQKEIEDQLEMIEMPRETDQIEAMQVEPASEAQEVQEEKVKRKDWMSGKKFRRFLYFIRSVFSN